MRREFFSGKRSQGEEEERGLQNKINMNLRCILRELDGPDPCWCPMLDSDTSGVEPAVSAVRQLV